MSGNPGIDLVDNPGAIAVGRDARILHGYSVWETYVRRYIDYYG
jgi:hypothetical protein